MLRPPLVGWFPPAIGLVILLLTSVFAVAGSGAAAMSSIEVSVDAPSDRRFGLGRSLTFRMTISNASEQDAAGSLSVGLTRLQTSRSIEIQQIDYSLEPGAARTDEVTVTSGQWFAGLGRYRVTVLAGDSVVDRFAFDVTASPVLVPRFRDVTDTVGIESTVARHSYCTGANYVAGAAWGDVEGDGDLDLYVPRQSVPSHLWINEGGHFREAAAAHGVTNGASVGIGAVFVDYDNDGDSDLYVVNQGANRLYRNDGSGRFADVAPQAGVDSQTPDASAAWGDYDGDGLLDLYVANWGTRCNDPDRTPDWTYFPDKLFHNNGDGTFSDRAELLAREGSTMGSGLQAAWFDYDDDDDLDLYLANDYYGPEREPNFLWRNDGLGGSGDWVFTNVSEASGAGLSINSMGIGIGDYDRDLDLDLAISDIGPLSVLRNNGDGSFSQQASRLGVDRVWQGPRSRAISWGLDFRDLNNDGWEDLYVAAGRLDRETSQPNMLFTNRFGRSFLDHSVPSRAADIGISKGVAFADYDRDGRIDLFVLNHDGEGRLYRNVTPKAYHWVEIQLLGRSNDGTACGASVMLATRSGLQRRDVFCGSTSLASGHDPALHFGLRGSSKISKLTIEWPSGLIQTRSDLATDRLIRILEPEN